MSECRPRLVVFSTLFPHPGQPHAGVFIRERMFRVGQELPLVVVAPVPWFPFQGLIRLFRRHFRPVAPYHEVQQGFDVYHPRFFSIPGFFKAWDGFFMALGSYRLLTRLQRQQGLDIIDAHFAYPDGYAATLLGKWCKMAVTITLRGTEIPLSKYPARRRRIVQALACADRVFSVAESLKRYVTTLGADADKILVVGNGVDSQKFSPINKAEARASLGLPADAPLLITVGGLVERKGFHRVIELLPELRRAISEFDLPDCRWRQCGGGLESAARGAGCAVGIERGCVFSRSNAVREIACALIGRRRICSRYPQ